jgi:hypothetical protein
VKNSVLLRGRKAPLLPICLLSAVVAGAVDDGKVFTAEDFRQNSVPRCSPGSEAISLQIQISSQLAPYRFTLIPEPAAAVDENLHHVGRIEISKPGADAILQTIEVKSNWNDSVCRLFDAKDVNFDGYLDISVVREGAGTWASRDYYLFDPQSGRFITNDVTHDLDELKDNGISVDWKEHEIRASFMVSLCGGMDVYRIENGRLVKVEEDTVRIDAERHQCETTVRRRIDGEWKVLRVERKTLPRLD